MSEQADWGLEPALRRALDEATAPHVSTGFDAAVMAELSRRRGPRLAFQTLASVSLRALRPALAAGCCAFVLGNAMLRWYTALPVPSPAYGAPASVAATTRPTIQPAAERDDIYGGSIARMLAARLALLHTSGVGGESRMPGAPGPG